MKLIPRLIPELNTSIKLTKCAGDPYEFAPTQESPTHRDTRKFVRRRESLNGIRKSTSLSKPRSKVAKSSITQSSTSAIKVTDARKVVANGWYNNGLEKLYSSTILNFELPEDYFKNAERERPNVNVHSSLNTRRSGRRTIATQSCNYVSPTPQTPILKEQAAFTRLKRGRGSNCIVVENGPSTPFSIASDTSATKKDNEDEERSCITECSAKASPLVADSNIDMEFEDSDSSGDQRIISQSQYSPTALNRTLPLHVPADDTPKPLSTTTKSTEFVVPTCPSIFSETQQTANCTITDANLDEDGRGLTQKIKEPAGSNNGSSAMVEYTPIRMDSEMMCDMQLSTPIAVQTSPVLRVLTSESAREIELETNPTRSVECQSYFGSIERKRYVKTKEDISVLSQVLIDEVSRGHVLSIIIQSVPAGLVNRKDTDKPALVDEESRSHVDVSGSFRLVACNSPAKSDGTSTELPQGDKVNGEAEVDRSLVDIIPSTQPVSNDQKGPVELEEIAVVPDQPISGVQNEYCFDVPAFGEPRDCVDTVVRESQPESTDGNALNDSFESSRDIFGRASKAQNVEINSEIVMSNNEAILCRSQSKDECEALPRTAEQADSFMLYSGTAQETNADVSATSCDYGMSLEISHVWSHDKELSDDSQQNPSGMLQNEPSQDIFNGCSGLAKTFNNNVTLDDSVANADVVTNVVRSNSAASNGTSNACSFPTVTQLAVVENQLRKQLRDNVPADNSKVVTNGMTSDNKESDSMQVDENWQDTSDPASVDAKSTEHEAEEANFASDDSVAAVLMLLHDSGSSFEADATVVQQEMSYLRQSVSDAEKRHVDTVVTVQVPSNEKIVFCSSGFTDMNLIKRFIFLFGGEYRTAYSPEITHMILPSDSSLLCRRTMKYFQAIAGRKWVASANWLEESVRQEKLLPVEMFEIRGDTVNGAHEGPQRARIGQTQLLHGFAFFLLEPLGDNLEFDVVKQLITAAGGTCCCSIEDLKRLGDSGFGSMVLTSKAFKLRADHLTLRYETLVVDVEWLITSIGEWFLCDLTGYMLNSSSTSSHDIDVLDVNAK